MTSVEWMVQGIGWIGMVLILIGMAQTTHTAKQVLLSTGAGLLAIMAALPVHPVFLSIEIAICMVGFLNITERFKLLKLTIIAVGAALGSYFAIQTSVGVDTWFAVAGLTGIALGYAGTPEDRGGNQFLWMGIGAVGMVVYSTFGVLQGVWQAWPFLVLNVPVGTLGFVTSARLRRCRILPA